MAAGFDLVARDCGGEEHRQKTGERGQGGDHGRVRLTGLDGIRSASL